MSATPVHSPLPHIDVEASADAAAVEALVLAAFGPGRFAKTAERLREDACVAVGFVMRDGVTLLGSVRLWSIAIGGTPADSIAGTVSSPPPPAIASMNPAMKATIVRRA